MSATPAPHKKFFISMAILLLSWSPEAIASQACMFGGLLRSLPWQVFVPLYVRAVKERWRQAFLWVY